MSTTTTAHPFKVFAPSFVEDAAAHTVSFPKYVGHSHGAGVTYVITDVSMKAAADRLGVNWAPRLANAAGAPSVQHVTGYARYLTFPATVDFTPDRVVVPGPTGFPPNTAVPGAVGEAGCSPLVQLADRTVLNAPQVVNDSRHPDKLASTTNGRVVYRETDSFDEHKAVHYLSFEASIPLAAALENATQADPLNLVPPDFPEGTPDPVVPAREEIGIVTNGQLDVTNP